MTESIKYLMTQKGLLLCLKVIFINVYYWNTYGCSLTHKLPDFCIYG